MATFNCYQVGVQSWQPGYNLAHSMKFVAPIRGVYWRHTDDTVTFQVESRHTFDFLKNYLSFNLGTDKFKLRVLSTEDYTKAVQEPGMAVTSSVEEKQTLEPEDADLSYAAT